MISHWKIGRPNQLGYQINWAIIIFHPNCWWFWMELGWIGLWLHMITIFVDIWGSLAFRSRLQQHTSKAGVNVLAQWLWFGCMVLRCYISPWEMPGTREQYWDCSAYHPPTSMAHSCRYTLYIYTPCIDDIMGRDNADGYITFSQYIGQWKTWKIIMVISSTGAGTEAEYRETTDSLWITSPDSRISVDLQKICPKVPNRYYRCYFSVNPIIPHTQHSQSFTISPHHQATLHCFPSFLN